MSKIRNLRGGERAYWNRLAKSYDRSMWLLGGPLPATLELTKAAVAGTGRVLEVAAGTGLVTIALAEAASHVVATDYAAEMVAKLKTRVELAGLTNVEFHEADIQALSFEPASFDAVVAANVLHLVPDFPAAIASLRRVLKQGGRLIVPTFCHEQTALSKLVSRLLATTGFPGHRRFSLQSLASSLEAEGLRISRKEVIPGVIPVGFVQGTFAPLS